MPSHTFRRGSFTRRATLVNPAGWLSYTWEMAKNRKTTECWDCGRKFPRGVMMFRPKEYKIPSKRRCCRDCVKRK